MIIHFHFHFKITGVTRSVESIVPCLNKFEETKVFGYGISSYRISFIKVLKAVFSEDKTVIHIHRNNEMLLALILRFFGGKFKLLSTRHSDSEPSRFTYYLMSKADSRISLSKQMGQNLKIETTTIGHGVDTSYFQPPKHLSTPKDKIISVFGRIRKSKGQRDVIEAAAPLLRKNPKWKVQFIGTVDSEQYAREIKTIAKNNAVENQLQFISQTNQMKSYYQNSSGVIIASYTEGFSLVCLEAMSCGCNTIATEQVGIHSEVIEHNKNGFLYPKGSISSLREIIKKVFENPSILEPKQIRQGILIDWSTEVSAQKLFEQYKKLRTV
tara:strand:- start:5727 stop:6704 length:978 start_codon:yes stop_codon:yes gene_type:complete